MVWPTADRRQPTVSRRDRRGVAAVEFAFVAPIFFLILVAAFEFGRLNVMRHTADNAAYEAARHAMVPGATADEAAEKARKLLNVVGTRGARITVDPPVLGPNVDRINVSIEVPLSQNGWITPRMTRAKTIRATSTLATERVRE
jgi:Flp pilus assembly protein TadG